MKRFQFRLESVLRLRRQFDRQAEVQQQRALRTWETAQLEVDQLLERLVQGAAAVEARIGKAIETDCWIARYQDLTQVRLAAEAAEVKASRAQALLEEANRKRRRTAAELESLMILRREKWREHRQEAAKAAQHQLDDAYLQRDVATQTTGPRHTGVSES